MFRKDYTGVSTKKPINYKPLENGTYTLKITNVEEKKTRNNDPMVNVTTEAIGHNHKIWHNVCFVEGNGAGIGKHWLKCIGEPFEGNVEVEPKNWINKTFTADIGTETYTANDGTEKTKNIIKAVDSDETDNF